MPQRTIIDVSPDGDRWKVQERGRSSASARHDSKEDAVEDARNLAKDKQPSQVVIRKEDGTIEEERTYQDDPFPPEG
jgi:hypothetical protein